MNRLFQLLAGVVFLALPLVVSPAHAITDLFGTAANCGVGLGCGIFPQTVTVLCTASCPTRSSFSWTNPSRFWGALGGGTGVCTTSTDGGVTFALCTTQPFATGANELYAGAADGSVIAVGTTTGPTTCTMRRSTDNGTSWNTQFTQAVNCSPSNNEGQYLYCLASGACELVVFDTPTLNYRVFRSSNNGVTWSIGEVLAADSGVNAGSAGVAWDGAKGFLVPNMPGTGGGNLATAGIASGDVWTVSGIWNGTQGDCWGNVVYNGAASGVCQGAGATPSALYTLRNATGVNVASLTLPGALTSSIDMGGVSLSLATNNLYIMATLASGGAASLWFSTDNLNTFIQLGPAAGFLVGMRGGNAFTANGCAYFTFVSGTARLLKVC